MINFFRFPSTPHLAWLSQITVPREDKLLSPSDERALLAGKVLVEEKIDGANIGISLAEDKTLLIQNRGQYLTAPYAGQFARLPEWLTQHEKDIRDQLDASLILFGEWSAARHSIGYDRLPDWFLLFDVYDRAASRFWSSRRRDALASAAGLTIVPALLRGHTNITELEQMLANSSSHYRSGAMEGLVVRCESTDWCESRGKLVRADFTQAIDEHWSRRRIEWNRVDWSQL